MWKTNKWVPEWVIRHAIAHLHGPSIRAGVRCTGAEHLNREPPPNHHATESYRWRQTKTLRLYIEPGLQPHLSKSFCYISVAPLRD